VRRVSAGYLCGSGNLVTKLGVVALAGPDNGGTYQYTLSMLHGLQHVRGFDITLFGDPANPDFIELGHPIVRLTESYAKQLAALVAHRIHLGLPDPFAAQDVLLAPIYSLALLHTSKPFAYTLHDLQELHFPENFSLRQRIWRRQIHSRLLKRARRVICESEYVKSDMVVAFSVPEHRITVVPAPPQRQFLAEHNGEQLESARVRLGLPKKFLVYPAHYWTHKNHLRLIDAFRLVVNEVPDLKLVLTGKKIDDYQKVVNAIDKAQLNDHVCHLGFIERDDLQAVYQLATALVMPSLFESVSIPIYEAFQLGTPVAASNVLAIPEQVGDAGLLFDPTSVTSIANAILTIVRDGELARRLGKRGRDRMQAMTPERYGDQLQAVLDDLKSRRAD
jgi:glycosyltransferase involved in cell wall biosynthesis